MPKWIHPSLSLPTPRLLPVLSSWNPWVLYIPPPSLPRIIHMKADFQHSMKNTGSGASQQHASSWGWWFTHLWLIFSSLEVALCGFQAAPCLFSLTVMKKTDVRTRIGRAMGVGLGGVEWQEWEESGVQRILKPFLSRWALKLLPASGRDQLDDPSPFRK